MKARKLAALRDWVAILGIGGGIITCILVAVRASPLAVLAEVLLGPVGSPSRIADVLVSWCPILLVTSGLLITFAAGLWNIGVEGQIAFGAICATGFLRFAENTSCPPAIGLAGAMLAGCVGGACWALVAGLLKTHGGVNEIFAGLGLNFVAGALTLWLIFGPWKRPGIGSMSGTQPLPEIFWLPVFGSTRLSPVALTLATMALLGVAVFLGRTFVGLRLKAVGANATAAARLGISASRHILLAFLICGSLAGLAGALQVLGVYHRLIPAISSGYGYLGLLVAMLANYRPLWTALVAFFFAVLNLGTIQLPMVFRLDSSLSGVIQATLVLVALLVKGGGKVEDQ